MSHQEPTEWPLGAPGSAEALGRGCSCPVLDNAYGRGVMGDGEKFGWWQTEGCRVHSAAQEEGS